MNNFIGLNHYVGNKFACISMDIDTLDLMINRGESIEKINKVLTRLKKAKAEFVDNFSMILSLTDFIIENGFTKCEYRNEKFISIKNADDVCTLFNVMGRLDLSIDYIKERLS